jgi:tetratricopeptide (TPR) repeat protein
MKAAPDYGPIRESLLEAYTSQKRWPQAVALLEAMIKENPDRENLLKLLRIHEVTSNTEGTISLLRRILRTDPEDLEKRLRLATILETEKRYGEAIQEYENLLKHTDKSEALEICKTLGFLYTKTNNPQKAIDSYLGAAQLNEKDANLFYNLSSLYETIGDSEKSDFYLEKAVKLNLGDTQGRIRLAENLLKKGQFKEAEEHLSVLLKKNPESMEALLLLSSIAEKRGDKKALKNHYKKILSLDPKNATLMYNIGVLEYESGNLRESLPHFETYVKYFPQDKEVHGLLFSIYRSLNRNDLAFNEAKTLTVLTPKRKELYLYIAEHLYNRKDFKGLISACLKGMALFPGEPELQKYLILSYLKTGQDDLAIKKMRELLKAKPKDKDLLLQLARLEDKKGRVKEALESYGKLLKLSPKNKEAREAYVRLLLEQGKEREGRGEIDAALASYKRVLGFAPKNRSAKKEYIRLLQELAERQEKQGKLKAAMGSYKKIIDLVPDHEQAQEAYLRLRMEGLPVER